MHEAGNISDLGHLTLFMDGLLCLSDVENELLIIFSEESNEDLL